jgi:hypothetical protein
MSDENDKQQTIAVTLYNKLTLYIHVIFGVLMLFALVGYFAGDKMKAMMFQAIVVIAWGSWRIVSEAHQALNVLHILKKLQNDKTKSG